MADQQQVSPTFFIGAGGTGDEVLNSLYRKIRQSPYSKYIDKVLHFFSLDTRPNSADPTGLPPERYFAATSFNGNAVVNGLLKSTVEGENFSEWWPDALNKRTKKRKAYQPGYIRDGASARRLVGRLALRYAVDSIEDGDRFGTALEHARDTCFDNVTRMINSLAIQRAQHIRVFIVTGLAGGTGSGMFIDLARIVNHVLRGNQPLIVGLGVMGDVAARRTNSANDHKSFAANTMAALLELNHFQRHDEEEPETFFSTMKTLSYTHPLYNTFQLVDFTDAKGNNYKTHENYVELTSQYLFNLAANPVLSATYFGALDNHLDRTREVPDTIEVPITFGSFGISRIRLDVPGITDFMVNEFSSGFLKELQSPGEVPCSEILEKILDEVALSSAERLKFSVGRAMPTAPTSHERFPAAKSSTVVSSFNKCMQDMRKWRHTSQGTVRQAADTLVEKTESLLRRLLEQSYLQEGGPTLTDLDTILNDLVGDLEGYAETLREQEKKAKLRLKKLGLTESGAAKGELGDTLKRLQSAYKSLFNVGVDKVKAEVVAKFREVIEVVEATIVCDSAARFCETVAKWGMELRSVFPVLREDVMAPVTRVSRSRQRRAMRRNTRGVASAADKAPDILADQGVVLNVLNEPHVIRDTVYREIVQNATRLIEVKEGLRQAVFDEGIREYWDDIGVGDVPDRSQKKKVAGDRLKVRAPEFTRMIHNRIAPVFSDHVARYDIWSAIEAEARYHFVSKHPHNEDPEKEREFIRREIATYLNSLERLCAILLQFADENIGAGVVPDKITVLAGPLDSWRRIQRDFQPPIPPEMLNTVEGMNSHEIVMVVSKTGYPLYLSHEINVDSRQSYDAVMKDGGVVLHTDKRFDSHALQESFVPSDVDFANRLVFLLAESEGHIAGPMSGDGRYVYRSRRGAKEASLVPKTKTRAGAIENLGKSKYYNEIVRRVTKMWEELDSTDHDELLDEIAGDLDGRRADAEGTPLADVLHEDHEIIRSIQKMISRNPASLRLPEV